MAWKTYIHVADRTLYAHFHNCRSKLIYVLDLCMRARQDMGFQQVWWPVGSIHDRGRTWGQNPFDFAPSFDDIHLSTPLELRQGSLGCVVTMLLTEHSTSYSTLDGF